MTDNQSHADRRRETDSIADKSLWPFRQEFALLGSLALIIVLLAGIGIMKAAHLLPEDRVSVWLLLGAALLSLIPVFLAVLDRVIMSAGTVEVPGGVKISFQSVQTAAEVDTVRTAISANLGGASGANIADSGGLTILQGLRPALSSEVVVLDLADGREWWQTRLLLLTSGAARLGRPRVLVFTATVADKPKQFVGWGNATDLLHAQLANTHPQLRHAYRVAQAQIGQWMIGIPRDPDNSTVTLPWLTPGQDTQPCLAPMGVAAPTELVPEQFVLSHLAPLEIPHALMSDLALNVPILHSLFTSVLRTDMVKQDAPDSEWRDAILTGTDDYLAVTTGGTYDTLVSRQAATNAVLRSLFPEEPVAGTRSRT